MNIGIIGGGFMGLALAHKLSSQNHVVDIYERDSQVGGLATYHDFGEFYWDKFYHVILPTDAQLLALLKELDLEDQIKWKKTYTGVYVDESFYSVSNSKEFLLFPPLNLWQKFRLGLTILYGSRIKDWRQMEQITVEEWLVKWSGKGTYEKFWKPLLKAKLGDSYSRVSAVFIWTYIKRLFEARDAKAHQEQMGYVNGGYKTVFDQFEHKLKQKGSNVFLETTVSSIYPGDKDGIVVEANGKSRQYDKVIFTAPVNVLNKVTDSSLVEINTQGESVEYLGVICMIILTKKPLTPFYVLNIADERIPFTGVIGMTTLVDKEETGGYYMTYLPKYILSTDPMLKMPDEEVKRSFLKGLAVMYPEFNQKDIVSIEINRAFKVQPLQVTNYSKRVPRIETLHKDFFVLNTSQFLNDTLNNNSVARHVERFVEAFQQTLSDQPSNTPTFQKI